MASKIKKLVDDAKEGNSPELDLVDKGVVNILDIPGFGKCCLIKDQIRSPNSR